MIIYIDESGNSGDNLLDENQKYFSIASFGIQKLRIPKFEEEIKTVFKNIPTAKDGDLKTSKTIGTKFEPLLYELFEIILKNNCELFSYVLERKFMITGLIVENYFDPLYNKNVDNSWTWPIPIKQELANLFYNNLTSNTINLCATAFKTGDIGQLTLAYNEIRNEIKNIAFKINVYKTLEGVEDNMLELSKILQVKSYKIGDESQIQASALRSPNTTTYYVLLNKIEEFLTETEHDASLIFDTSRQFNNAFSALFNLHLKAPRKVINTGKQKIYYGFEKIKSFQIDKSENHIGLQMSDLIASSFVHIIKVIDEEKETLTKFEFFLLALMNKLIETKYLDYIMSEKLMKKFFDRFIKEVEKITLSNSC